MATYNDILSRSDNGAIEIPESVAAEIVKGASGESVVMQLAKKTRMPAKSHRVPVLSVLPTGYWVNGDTGLKQTTKVQWENVYLTAEPIAVLVAIPDDFLADATVPLWSEIQPLVAEAFGRVLDDAALWNINRPASWSDSVYQHAVAAGNYVELGQNFTAPATSSDLGQDIAAMGEQLANDGFDLRALAVKPGLQWRLSAMRDSNGQPIYTNLVGDQKTGLYGVPFVTSSNGSWKSDVHAIGGDWSNAIVGVRQDMTMTLHTDAVISDDSGNVVFNAMQQDSTIGRFVMRVGFAISNPATNQNTVKASRSPFSLLVDSGSAAS